MISIVTAYYNRKKLFRRTLLSIKHQQVDYSFEVIAVDDGSDDEERLEDLVVEFPFLKVIRLEKNNKWYHNSCIPFNIGFKAAKGDKIIIQNPECLHFGNILDYTDNHLDEQNYLSFGCFSLDEDITENYEKFSTEYLNKTISENSHTIEKDGALGWYNHSVYRPKAYHFCTAISKKNLQQLHGFDERFAFGIAYDDDEFIERVRQKLRVDFVDHVVAFHQNHYHPSSTSYQNRANIELLYKKNAFLAKKRNMHLNPTSFSRHLPVSLKKPFLYLELKMESLIRILQKK
ncbi:glycosyltransferase family 2 protein [Chryseobacterium sp. 6424]|uniref:glycosyltransferase family 2 protein n=1 Tax=Chryseobacterium sp. 6424 TaxID=2039166 RepID=UPI0013CF1CC6|nr:glycosyltransferase [Chryseobacterium sp. 6424]